MSRFSRRWPLCVAGVLIAAAAAAAGIPAALAGVSSQDPASPPAFPTFVHLPTDQAAHPGVQNEWWYIVGHVQSGGHRFGYEVQLIAGTNFGGESVQGPELGASTIAGDWQGKPVTGQAYVEQLGNWHS